MRATKEKVLELPRIAAHLQEQVSDVWHLGALIVWVALRAVTCAAGRSLGAATLVYLHHGRAPESDVRQLAQASASKHAHEIRCVQRGTKGPAASDPWPGCHEHMQGGERSADRPRTPF